MRFKAEGPSIPDRLLEERDQGKVVFFCGAGVSIPAGMPSFQGLAKDIYEVLDPEVGSYTHETFQPWLDDNLPLNARTQLDQVFDAMRLEFGPDVVNRAVARRLNRVDFPEHSKHHEIVARLSRDLEGNQRVVTTNFDTLFERTGIKGAKTFREPSNLPVLPKKSSSFVGTIYLHGRLRPDAVHDHKYILGSADFGDAYLLEGKTTEFVKKLVERFTLVFVGYSAEDPPIRMLFQGLGSRPEHDPERVYAFERGENGDVRQRWSRRGVTGIAYSDESKDHRILWDTLGAWAHRADDPESWTKEIVSMASLGPGYCEPHERGQVLHVAGTLEGAREFAAAAASPPPTWLCVFDQTLRQSENMYGFSPAAQFGLGLCEVEHSPGHERRAPEAIFSDGFFWNGTGEPDPSTIEGNLLTWLYGHASEPVVAWWCIKHPNSRRPILARACARVLADQRRDEMCLWVWTTINENVLNDPAATRRRENSWVKLDITSDTSREDLYRLEETCAPYIRVAEATGLASLRPPIERWGEVDKTSVGAFEFQINLVPRTEEGLPQSLALGSFSMALRVLTKGRETLEDISFRNAPDQVGPVYTGQARPRHLGQYVEWTISIMRCAAGHDPDGVSERLGAWTHGENADLARVLFAAIELPQVYSGRQAAELLLSMDPDSFWEPLNEDLMLEAINSRWEDFDDTDKLELLEKLQVGHPDPPLVGVAELGARDRPYSLLGRGFPAAGVRTSRLGVGGQFRRYGRSPEANQRQSVLIDWLAGQGCEFPEGASERFLDFGTFRELSPEANVSEAEALGPTGEVAAASESEKETVGQGEEDEVAEAVARAMARGGADEAERSRFGKLFEQHGERVLLVLACAARRGEVPGDLWREVLASWPEGASKRQLSLLYAGFARMPSQDYWDLREQIGRWISEYVDNLEEGNSRLGSMLVGDFVERLVGGRGICREQADSFFSSRGFFLEVHKDILDSERFMQVEIAVRALIRILVVESDKNDENSAARTEFRRRANRLISLGGTGRDHAFRAFGANILTLLDVDREWVDDFIVPRFRTDRPEASALWGGVFLGSSSFPLREFDWAVSDLAAILKVANRVRLGTSDVERGLTWLVEGTLRSIGERQCVADGRECIPNGKERAARKAALAMARSVVRELPDMGKVTLIDVLQRFADREEFGWELCKRFFAEAWPRDPKVGSEAVTERLVELLEWSGRDFPNTLIAVRDILGPFEWGGCNLHYFAMYRGVKNICIAHEFPKDLLWLVGRVVPHNGVERFGGIELVLDEILQACPELESDKQYSELRCFVVKALERNRGHS